MKLFYKNNSILRVSLLFVLIIPLLLSCEPGKETAKPGQTVLEFMWFGDLTQEKIMRDIIDEYTALNPDVVVSLQNVEWSQFQEKLMIQVIGNQPPDICRMSVQWCSRYAVRNKLADLNPYITAENQAEYLPSRLASCKFGDRLFGLPQDSIGLMVFYNRDVAEKAGIKIPQTIDEAWTWDEFEAAAVKFQETGMDYGWGMFRGFFPLMPWIYQNGGTLLEDDLTTPAINKPAAVEALEWLARNHQSGLAPATSWSGGGDSAETLYIRQRMGMVITGNWRVAFFPEQITNFNWDVTYLPYNKQKATNSGGENLVVFDTPNAEKAADFILFATNKRNMERFCGETMFIPARHDLLVPDFPYRIHPEMMNRFAE